MSEETQTATESVLQRFEEERTELLEALERFRARAEDFTPKSLESKLSWIWTRLEHLQGCMDAYERSLEELRESLAEVRHKSRVQLEEVEQVYAVLKAREIKTKARGQSL